MKELILTSKLNIPRIICPVVRRDSLLTQIHERPEPVIVLHAGAGYGKTVVMAEYFQSYNLDYCWYQLEKMDDDMERFLTYFETALQGKVPGLRVHEGVRDWNRDMAERAARQILEQLEGRTGQLNILLDDFQNIKNPLIYDFLGFFIRHISEGIRLFFLVKGEFPVFLTRYMLQGTVGVLRAKDLRITEEQLSAFPGAGVERKKADSLAKRIIEETEGWAIAVQEAMAGIRKDGSDMENRACAYEDASGYLFYEIISPLPTEQQIFMAESSLLPVITVELCEQVLGNSRAGEYLNYFVNQQLLVERKEKGEYRYHPMLKSVLEGMVEKERREEIKKRWTLAIQKGKRQKTCKGGGESRKREENVEVRCFGGIRIHTDRQQEVHWRTRKTREMFGYFWERQKSSLSKEEIIDVLWQAEDVQRTESLFHTTLSYLKKAFLEIGIPDVIEVKNKKYSLTAEGFHSDTQSLRELFEQWKKKPEILEVERSYEELNQIYQGDYMEDLEGSWVLGNQEYYQNIYLQCCELLIRQANRMHQYQQAIVILERAVEMDPYSEQLNGMLIQDLSAVGQFRLAKLQYEKYERLLKEELNIGIGRQVWEIYQNNILRRSS